MGALRVVLLAVDALRRARKKTAKDLVSVAIANEERERDEENEEGGHNHRRARGGY